MKERAWLIILFLISLGAGAQGLKTGSIKGKVITELNSLGLATVELWKGADKSLVKATITDSSGVFYFDGLAEGNYWCRISGIGYKTITTSGFEVKEGEVYSLAPVTLLIGAERLKEVTVTSRKPLIELKADKTIVNLENSLTAVGTTVLEALEKMPGVTVDKDGNISLKGRASVLVMIDEKPTYLSGTELAALLGGMSATQVSQVEIMSHPPAKYDASGNAGIINIRTKKIKQQGFNGAVTVAYGQGRYPKTNNSLQVAYRTGKLSLFLNYSLNANRSFTRIWALRSYFMPDGKTITSLLEQPSLINGRGTTHTLRTGLDYYLTNKTTLGITASGTRLSRLSETRGTAYWMNAQRVPDSAIETETDNTTHWRNAGINLNMRHAFTSSRQLSADLDVLGYDIKGKQYSENKLTFPGAYQQALRGDLPAAIHILSGKLDYTDQWSKSMRFDGGWKSSHITTDNEAVYDSLSGATWKPDLGKTNHFLYTENIHAVYGAIQSEKERWTIQTGLRYEMTAYEASQLGNVLRKDSSFSRSYNSLFPTAFISYKADSINTFTISAGRRIDRPGFQKLNPFVFIINKYTAQQGNPFYKPQYTWNFELSHLYKDKLVTSINYSRITDYFSQIFFSDSTGMVIYTEGNLGRAQLFGASVGLQFSPLKWWSFNGQAILTHKQIEGAVYGRQVARITQMNFNLVNTFRFGKSWGAELSGFYTTRSQTDLQEVVDPSGQLSGGLSKTAFKGKGTFKLGVRDIFYTQAMIGFTTFDKASEYFSLRRDTRVATLSFTYRFGKQAKAPKRSEGAAKDEIQRVGNG